MSYKFLDFDLDPVRHQLTRRGGPPLRAPRQIFDLLLLLIRHRDRPVSKEEILATVWHGRAVTDASLTHAIATARRLLGDSPKSQTAIKTVNKRGYWWVAETVESHTEPTDTRRRPFVGRRDELRVLSGAFDEVRSGRHEFALIVGEAGVGKSRLIEQFTEGMRRDGSLVLAVCGQDLSPTPPLYLWRQALAQLASSGLADPRVDRILGSEFSKGQGSSDVDRDGDLFLESVAAKLRLFESLQSALRHVSNRTRLAIVLEDLHNADAASLEALQFLVSSPRRPPILFVATHRPLVSGSKSDLSARLTRLTRSQGTRFMLLRNLSATEVKEFLADLSDSNLPAAGSEMVFRASGGNPFLLWQLVALARARGGLGESSSLSPLPSTVRSAIAAHTQELPPGCQDLLTLAAIAGQTFDLLVVAAAAGMDPSDVSALLKSCIDAGIIRVHHSHRLEFSHALVRDALYEDVDIHERAKAHLAIGNAMMEIFGAESGDRLPAMALHFREAAEVGGRYQAISLLRRCGALAAQDLAFEDAVSLLEDALTLIRSGPSPDREVELTVMLAISSARLCSGDRAGARKELSQLAELAAADAKGEMIAEAALSFAPSVLSLEVGVVDDLLITTLERSLELLPADRSELRTELAGRLALALYWTNDDDRRETARAILEQQSQSASPEAQARSSLFSIGANWSPDTLEARRGELARLHSKRAHLPSSLAPVARVYRIAMLLETGSLVEMDREIQALERELSTAQAPYCAWYPTMFRATQCLYRGELDRTLELAREYVEIGERFEDSNVGNSFAAHWGEVQWLRGNAIAAVSAVEEFARRFPAMLEWSCVVAFFHVLIGRHDEARDFVARAAHTDFSILRGRRNMSFTIAVCSLVEVVTRLELREWAGPLYDLLIPFRGRNVVGGYGVISWGSVSRFLGQLAVMKGGLEGVSLLEEALRSDSSAGSDPWIARSEIALAHALMMQGDEVARASRLAGNARDRAEGRGMVQLASEARKLLVGPT